MAAAGRPLRPAERRPLILRLLCGLVLHVSCWYCPPARRSARVADPGRPVSEVGLYPELALLGFSGGHSPARVQTVARAAVLYPSFELARRELARRGIRLDIKTVQGITHRLGAQMLTQRKADLLAWRKRTLPSTDELAGKRIGVALDGGRTRLRENRRRQIGRGPHKQRRRRYQATWREPKLLIIFELDDRGRMKAGTQAVIDGTFQGPDALMELLAVHLHRLGAARAREVVFISDGAPWIWARLAWVQQQVGLEPPRVVHVLDWCHAVHHLSLAVAELKVSDEARSRIFRRLRRHLRGGRSDLVLCELRQRAGRRRPGSEIWRVIDYLERHRLHMDYRRLRQAGCPMGSGAIESAIRRVINQRLKANGTIWLAAHAEGMLVLRAAALGGRWDQALTDVRATMATSRRIDWQWSSPDIVAQLNPGLQPTAEAA